ncbi:hypothetical protein [Mycobacteroides abscessus]|uniref:hypothetical protein n=1 Tax=Mycobacteroides abscessus TaxID=36809 RepID=UPI0018964042
MVAGKAVTPSEHSAARRLKEYWTKGEGAAKIVWNTPGDFERSVAELGTAPQGLCNTYHVAATGGPPGRGSAE